MSAFDVFVSLFYQWNVSLIAEAESVDTFLFQCGVSLDPPSPLPKEVTSCCSCYMDFGEERERADGVCELYALACGHPVCRECWALNIRTRLSDYRPNSIECPGKDCRLCLLEEDVRELGCPEDVRRYKEQLVEVCKREGGEREREREREKFSILKPNIWQTYIQNHQRMLYCNEPKCNLVLSVCVNACVVFCISKCLQAFA